MAATSPDNLYVTKLAAARRQLLEAIRMFFAEQDELAIHTVAAAAHRIIADLKAERGRDEAGDFFLTMTFFVVRDYRRGTLPRRFIDDPKMMKFIREMADQLPISATTEYEEVKAHPDSKARKQFWKQMNKASNFLKHADQDATASLSMDDVDNLNRLIFAYSSYRDLVKGAVELEPEGLVLWVYHATVNGIREDLPEKFQLVATTLEGMSNQERLSFCFDWLTSMNKEVIETSRTKGE